MTTILPFDAATVPVAVSHDPAPIAADVLSTHDSDASRQLKSLLGNSGICNLSTYADPESDVSLGGHETSSGDTLSNDEAREVGCMAAKGWIRVTGNDRVRWLNGMVTNSIQQLQPGQGCYNFILSAQGRIQGDCYAFAQPDALLIETDRAQVAPLLALLDRFIIMDDVELRDESEEWSGIRIAGPQAAAALGRIGFPAGLQPVHLESLPVPGGTVRFIAAHSYGVPRFEIWATPEAISEISRKLIDAGADLCGERAVEWLRILEGAPRYGTDIRDKDLPQETAQSHALHFSKGCYIGQEIVERIRSRGSVHRTFAAFLLHGEPPAAGALLEADGQKAGELTSFSRILVDGHETSIALGYARRDALGRHAVLRYPGGTAEPVSLPHLPAWSASK